ncbi:MAG TPA: AAA family ATPase [Halococcus sp.]|nr:AAA family ATPase [Halococcus sp.]
MRVIGIVGLPGSGKSEAATVARELEIPVVAMGDVIRQACRDRSLDPAAHHGRVARELREEGGPAAIAERSLPVIERALDESSTVLVEGIRSGVEVERFEASFEDSFTLVAIEAPFEMRAERITARGRDTPVAEGGEGLRERDERELGFGMGNAIERADITIENIDSLAAFHDRIQTLLASEEG